MGKSIKLGGCVKIPDGRVARVRKRMGNKYIVRVRRKTSATHQFLKFEASQLHPIACPKGWMSIAGYNRYLKITLAKMKKRQRLKNSH